MDLQKPKLIRLKLLKTGLFVAIVAGVLSYAYFIEYKGSSEKQEQEERSKLIVGLEKESIQKMEFKNSRGIGLFEKTGAQWMIKGELEDIADNQQIENILTQLLGEKFEEVVAEGDNVDSSIFGITDKSSSITFSAPSTQVTVQIGTETSVGNKKYLKLNNSNKVLLVSPTWEYLLERDFKDFISKDLLPRKEGIQKINIKSPKQILHFETQGGNWKLLDLKTDDKDQDAITQIHNNVRSLKAAKLFSQAESDIAKVGLDKPAFQIDIFFEDGTKETISFTDFNKTREVIVKSSARKGLYLVNEHSGNFITKSLEDYRDRKRPFRLASQEFSRLSYKSSLSSFDLKNVNGEWLSIQELKGKEIDQVQMNDLLTRIQNLKINLFLDKDFESQKSGMNELKLFDEKGQEVLFLEWPSRPIGTNFIMRSSLEKYPFGVDMKDISALPFHRVVVDKAANGDGVKK